jgi:carboxypeptidase D
MIMAAGFEVTSLPGLSTPLPFRHHAGLLPLGSGGRMFFWLVESSRDPAGDPLVIWLNGGPGDSSLNGLLLENGPFDVQLDGTVALRSPSWNSIANVLYVEMPLGTGWSSEAGAPVTTAARATADFIEFLDAFYGAFPAYRGRPLFLTGESFAGHYIAAIADALIRRAPGPGDSDLRGVALGNPWLDPLIQYGSNVEYACAVGMLGESDRPQAEAAYNSVFAQIRAGKANADTFNAALMAVLANSGTPDESVNMYDVTDFDQGSGFNWPDAERAAVQAYMARDDVKTALHADGATTWQAFNPVVFQNLLPWFFSSARPQLSSVVEQVPVVIYAGQWDLMANHLGQRRVLNAMEWSGAEAFASATRYVWVVNGMPAGWAETAGHLTYLCVAQAGHMVPRNVPAAALDMLDRLLTGRSFDDYRFNTKAPARTV